MLTPLENIPPEKWAGLKVECFNGRKHENAFSGGKILQVPKDTFWQGRGKVLVELPSGIRLWVKSEQVRAIQ